MFQCLYVSFATVFASDAADGFDRLVETVTSQHGASQQHAQHAWSHFTWPLTHCLWCAQYPSECTCSCSTITVLSSYDRTELGCFTQYIILLWQQRGDYKPRPVPFDPLFRCQSVTILIGTQWNTCWNSIHNLLLLVNKPSVQHDSAKFQPVSMRLEYRTLAQVL
jgi:hypothetical protein